MSAEVLFSLGNSLAIACWLVLAASLFWQRLWSPAQWIGQFGLPVLLGSAYVVIYLLQPDEPGGSFDSIAGVRQLFSSDWVLLVAWLHYLVFDYFVGSWVVRDSRRRAVNRWLVLPCLFFCLMAGPAGLLLYLGVRGGTRMASSTSK